MIGPDDCLARFGRRTRYAIGITSVALILIVGSLIGSGAMRVSESSTGDADVTIYYWPFLARAAALIRMCDEVPNAKCPHVSELSELERVTSAAGRGINGDQKTDTFAPPVLLDHRNGLLISQSVAATMYLGKQLGFEAPIPNIYKAVQYVSAPRQCLPETILDFALPMSMRAMWCLLTSQLNDLADLNGETYALEKLTEASKWPAFFAKGGRLHAWLGTIERSIVGPFYFGSERSYVDFYLLQVFDWHDHSLFKPLLPATGDVLIAYPKIAGVLRALRASPAYAQRSLKTPEITITPDSQEYVDAYQAAAKEQ
jgi:hypothetical protein